LPSAHPLARWEQASIPWIPLTAEVAHLGKLGPVRGGVSDARVADDAVLLEASPSENAFGTSANWAPLMDFTSTLRSTDAGVVMGASIRQCQ
jgi:hypothetical protein